MIDGAGVIYFNVGTKHCARLAVSLFSLRKHYDGPITVLDTGESGGIIERIAADERLAVQVQSIEMKRYAKHSAYVRKAGLWRDSPYPVTLFFDADTVAIRPIKQLLEIIADGKNPGFVVTRFSSWLSTGDIISSRIKQWRDVEVQANPAKFQKSIDVKGLVRQSLSEPHPAINTGVWGARIDDSKRTLESWERLSKAGHACSFVDELAAQILIRQEPHTLLSDRYNASPLFAQEKDKAVVWHFHGSKHVSREDGRGDQGHAIWFPIFREAWAADIGGITRWAPAGDDRLAKHLPPA